ncbi:MAG: NADH-quinone oxidoreductase subunit NuoE [Endomicrobium sp.]|jgi:NADH-quinone oxidoreductase subunit E|nr:NADH-quinone oxidoreductase subunit NuoE [Endomicrobium sp.]
MKSNYEKFRSVCSILEKYSFDKSKLVPILQAVQEEYKYLPQEVLAFISSALNISPANVYGVATFYSHFSLTPKGRYIIRVCDGTACHVKKSESIIEALRKKLNLSNSETTTKDMLFTLETVACLGACGLAPAVVLDGKVHGQMTPSKVIALIDQIKE